MACLRMAQVNQGVAAADSAKWGETMRDIYLEGCCQILRLDLDLRTTSARSISARLSHFWRRAVGQAADTVAGILRPEIDSLHVFHANFDHQWSGVSQQGFGEHDACHNALWRTMQPALYHKAQEAALKLLQRQIRSESTQTLTEILYSAVSRVTLGREAETPALQHLYRLLNEDNRAALLGLIKQGCALD